MTNGPTEPQAFVRLHRVYPAPRERVFRAWTDPKALERWFRPFGRPISVACLDLRLGGRYQFNINEPGGKISAISGHYVEILPPEKLVYTWVSEATDSHETLVTMLLIEHNAMTELTLRHERFARPEQIQPHVEGWTAMLDSLDTVFTH